MNKSVQFNRKTWETGALSSLLIDLARALNAGTARVTFTRRVSDGKTATTDGGPEEVYDVTELPLGRKVLIARFVRESDDLQISNQDILSVDRLGAEVVFLVFGSTAEHYQVEIVTSQVGLLESTFALLIDRLSLQAI